MKTAIYAATCLALGLCINATAYTQNTRAFNQNASRSNHTRLMASDGWDIGIGTGTSFAPKNNEAHLFRGNSIATKLFATYNFSNIGIGITSGIIPGNISDNGLNSFIAERKFPIDQLQINRSKSLNSYLLAGPSARFGKRVSILADLKGGIFFNDPGSVNINQSGITRPLYRFEKGDKNMFPGFTGSINIAYPLSNNTRFFINTDYFQTSSSIRLFDPSGGIDVPSLVKRSTQLFTAGIGIVRSFSGNERQLHKPLPDQTAVRNPATENDRAYTRTGTNNANMPAEQNCGPVTQRQVNADGTTQEITFSCPADAVAYNNRLSMNVTTPKQTQGKTFGEKVSSGLHAAGSHIVSGELIRVGSSGGTIITNKTTPPPPRTGTLSGSGGAVSSSYARQAMTTPIPNTHTTFLGRETVNGATARQTEYSVVYDDNNPSPCTDCMAAVHHNPLYKGSGTAGNNPMHEARVATQGNSDGGISNVDIALLDATTETIVATTRTNTDGSFFFANIPDGDYIVQVSADLTSTSTYEITPKKNIDLMGRVELIPTMIELHLHTGDGTTAQQKAGISTSRSNVRTRSLSVIDIDSDNDGVYESIQSTLTHSDGTTATVNATTTQINGKETIVIAGEGLQHRRRRVEVLKSNKTGPPANSLTSITITEDGTATATFTDGRTQIITSQVQTNTSHNGIKQYRIFADDTDNDGLADAIVHETALSLPAATDNRIKMISVTAPQENNTWRPVGPIKGVIVRGSRSNENTRTIYGNEQGEFELTGLQAAINYTFDIEQQTTIWDRTPITVRTASQDSPVQQPATTDNKPIARPGKIAVLKSISIEADLDGDGEYETDITSKLNDMLQIDDKGEITVPQQKAGVSTSRSNIRTRSATVPAGNNLYIGYGTTELNNKTVPVKIIYKGSGLKDTLKTQV